MMQLLQFNTRQEWLDARCNYITASDVGTLLGINKYKTLPVLVREKKEKVNLTESTVAMDFGNVMEKTILRCFEHKSGITVQMFDNNIAVNSDYPRLSCSLDGLSEDGECVIDAKMTSGGAAHQWGKKEYPCGVPPQYYAQMQAQMLVTGTKIGYLAVLKKPDDVTEVDLEGMRRLTASCTLDEMVRICYASGYRFDDYFVPVDTQFQEAMLVAIDNFFEDYIIGDKEPELTSVEEIKQLGIVPTAGNLVVDDAMWMELLEYNKLNKQKAALEKQVKALGDILKLKLAPYEQGEYEGNKVFTYGASGSRIVLDEKKLKEEMPEVWAKYLVFTPPTRRFEVKIK